MSVVSKLKMDDMIIIIIVEITFDGFIVENLLQVFWRIFTISLFHSEKLIFNITYVSRNFIKCNTKKFYFEKK